MKGVKKVNFVQSARDHLSRLHPQMGGGRGGGRGGGWNWIGIELNKKIPESHMPCE